MNNEIIKYRRERAKETLEEANIMFNNAKFFATVNRIYYAMFYEVTALLLTKDFHSGKHSGIRGYFNKEFVKTGVIEKDYGAFYNNMFEFRQRGDYEDFVEFDKDEVKNWLEKADEFISLIDEILTLKENETA